MKSSSSVSVKRCRPMLGTYVIVTVKGTNERWAGLAAERAFQAVEKVQQLMSAHEPHSDLGRITRSGAYEPLEVHLWTHQVLGLAQKVSLLSQGTFDVMVGGRLEQSGFLPRFKEPTRSSDSTYADLDLLPGSRVMLRRPCRLDLGGIAKGFAVDKAVEAALQGPGVQAVTVNAGGDIRIQADRPQELWLRDPFRPEFFWQGGLVTSGSFASSGGVNALRDSKHGLAAPLLCPGQKRPPRRTPGVLVAATTCAVADALTKVVGLAQPHLARRVVGEFGAKAWVARPGEAYRELTPSHHRKVGEDAR
ncbi:MAG TPA: FAD:protein FMN transferase [bacterium]|nr:FAD:protein FMN transferase [bacterium]